RNSVVSLRHMIRKHAEFRNAISNRESKEKSSYDRRSSYLFADILVDLMDSLQSRASRIKDGLNDKSITPHILEKLSAACGELVHEMVDGTEAEYEEALHGGRQRMQSGDGNPLVGR
ncbi:MAG: hypothetical protein KDK33_19595, partial [Leptospiraceae bacterium]|nr:hypothetical protein [Leptospiraceae bacterium]